MVTRLKTRRRPSWMPVVLLLAVIGVIARLIGNNHHGAYEMSDLLLATSGEKNSVVSASDERNQQQALLASPALEEQRNKIVELSHQNDCLKEVLHNLPIVAKETRRHPKGLVRAHHYDAHNLNKWNANSRLDPFPSLPKSNCTIWEVGAHKHAADSKAFYQTYPQCHFHAFEPVPAYHAVLQKRWQNEARMTTHNYGIANQATTLHLDPKALAGQSTFVQDSNQNKETDNQPTIPLQIVAFETAFHDAGGYPTVLHMNCEGCEWDFLPQASYWLKHVAVIQIGFHAYPYEELGERAMQYCQIRQLLSTTHDLQPSAVPFGWERWIRKANR